MGQAQCDQSCPPCEGCEQDKKHSKVVDVHALVKSLENEALGEEDGPSKPYAEASLKNKAQRWSETTQASTAERPSISGPEGQSAAGAERQSITGAERQSLTGTGASSSRASWAGSRSASRSEPRGSLERQGSGRQQAWSEVTQPGPAPMSARHYPPSARAPSQPPMSARGQPPPMSARGQAASRTQTPLSARGQAPMSARQLSARSGSKPMELLYLQQEEKERVEEQRRSSQLERLRKEKEAVDRERSEERQRMSARAERQKSLKEEAMEAKRSAQYVRDRRAAVADFLVENDFTSVTQKRTKMMFSTYPLHVAAEQGEALMVRYLLEEGADRQLKNSTGRTPGQVARRKNKDNSHDEVLRALGEEP